MMRTLLTLAISSLVLSSQANEMNAFESRSTQGFIENVGQFRRMDGSQATEVLFKFERNNGVVWITTKGLAYQFFKDESVSREISVNPPNGQDHQETLIHWESIFCDFEGANIRTENIEKLLPNSHMYNYFNVFKDSIFFDVKSYSKIILKEIYPGIDWSIYTLNNGELKYDFIVHPNGDPAKIRLLYRSQNGLKISKNNDLEVSSKTQKLVEKAPISFYQNNEILTDFVILDSSIMRSNSSQIQEFKLGFQFDNLEEKRQGDLIIDPELTWSTFFGPVQEMELRAIKTDSDGNVYIAGRKFGDTFPVKTNGMAYFQGVAGNPSIFLLKFNRANELVWSTLYGDSGRASSLAIDSEDNVYVAGWDFYDSFPTYSESATAFVESGVLGAEDLILLKFSATGRRLWATRFGGSSWDVNPRIAVDNKDRLVLTFRTNSSNCPLVNPGGGAYFKNSSVGEDIYVARFAKDLSIEWATYFGGDDEERPWDICADNLGNIFLSGYVQDYFQKDLPIVGPTDALKQTNLADGKRHSLIVKFGASGELLWSTMYGGSENTDLQNIITDQNNELYCLGFTNSPDLLLKDMGAGAYYDDVLNTKGDLLLLKFTNSGVLKWGTYLGGSGAEFNPGLIFPNQYNRNLAVDTCGRIHLSFLTNSNDLPVKESCEGGYFDNAYSSTNAAAKVLPGLYPKESDVFMIRFSGKGQLQWNTYFGSNGTAVGTALAIDNFGNTYLAGTFAGYNLGSVDPFPLVNPGGNAYFRNSGSENRQTIFSKFSTWESIKYSVESKDDNSCLCDGSAKLEVQNACPPFEFSWSNGAFFAGDIANSEITNLCGGEYSVIVKSKCAPPDTVYFEINSPQCVPEITVPNDTICQGECADVQATLLNGLGVNTVAWNGNPGVNGLTQTFCPNATSDYFVVAENALGSDTAFFTIVVNPKPEIDLGSDTLICKGSLVLDATYPEANYTWSTASTTASIETNETGLYWVKVALDDCFDIDSINLSFGRTINFPNDTTLCQGDTILLRGIDEVGATHLWQDGSTDNFFEVTRDGIYTLELIDDFGCTVNGRVEVLYSQANLDFAYRDTFGCKPITTLFENLSSLVNDNVMRWTWTYGDGNQSFERNGLNQYGESGNYAVALELSTATGCQYNADKMINLDLYDQPNANFDVISSQEYYINERISVKNKSTYANSWQWYFGDGNQSQLEEPENIYTVSGTYTINLYVSNDSVCFDSTKRVVKIVEPILFYVPNTFTPNGDEKNEEFKPVLTSGFNPADFSLIIFNRYGEKIFESASHDVGWDGKYQGNEVQDGVYVWQVVFGEKDSSGKRKYNGHVVLLR